MINFGFFERDEWVVLGSSQATINLGRQPDLNRFDDVRHEAFRMNVDYQDDDHDLTGEVERWHKPLNRPASMILRGMLLISMYTRNMYGEYKSVSSEQLVNKIGDKLKISRNC